MHIGATKLCPFSQKTGAHSMGPQIVMPQQIRMMTLAFFQDALIQKPSTISHGQMLIQTERLQSQIFY
jgi:hypothetical protein